MNIAQALTLLAVSAGAAGAQQERAKDPAVATIASAILSGGGQFYSTRYVKGLAIWTPIALSAAIATAKGHEDGCNSRNGCSLDVAFNVSVGLSVIGWVYGFATAARDARDFNDENRVFERRRLLLIAPSRNGVAIQFSTKW